MTARFEDRAAAGVALAAALGPPPPHAVVVALAGPGLAVGLQVATAWGCPLDVVGVATLGPVDQPAWGAVGEGGQVVTTAVPPPDAAAVVAAARLAATAAARRQRGALPVLDLRGAAVLVVDDGAATGTRLRAGHATVSDRGPTSVAVALPVVPAATLVTLQAALGPVTALARPFAVRAVRWAYRDQAVASDEDLAAALAARRG